MIVVSLIKQSMAWSFVATHPRLASGLITCLCNVWQHSYLLCWKSTSIYPHSTTITYTNSNLGDNTELYSKLHSPYYVNKDERICTMVLHKSSHIIRLGQGSTNRQWMTSPNTNPSTAFQTSSFQYHQRDSLTRDKQ